MPFSIETSGTFPSHYPRFGQIGTTNGLKLAVRSTDPRNFRDLSDLSQTLTPSGNVQYTNKGLMLSGADTINTTLLNADNNFTILAVLESLSTDTSQGIQSWAGGTYGATPAMGIGLYLRTETDTVNAGKKRIVLRLACDGKTIDTNASNTTFYSLTLIDNLASVPLSTKPLFVAVTIDTTNFTTSTVGLYCPSLNKTSVQTTSNRDHRATQRATYNSPIQVGAVPDNTVVDDGLKTRYLPEFMYFNRSLSQAEVNAQYALTKQWMTSTGSFDLSEWV